MKFIDLKGKQFGDWHVDEYYGDRKWVCTCKCGYTAVVAGYDLRNGNTKGCIMCKGSRQIDDLTGKQFNDWTVIRYIGPNEWECMCKCGTVKTVQAQALKNGNSKMCHKCAGSELIDLTGKEYGDITVIEYAGDKSWKCKCKCGNISIVKGQKIRNGLYNRCTQCAYKEIRKSAKDTLIEKYGDYSYHHRVLPRTEEQLTAISCKEELERFIQNKGLCGCCTKTLAKYLGINEHNTLRYIHKYGLDELINITTGSNGEDEIYKYIKEELHINNIIRHDRTLIAPYEIDIYMPDIGYAIEYNGTYWHSDMYKDIRYHQYKTIELTKIGVKLIHIFEYEWEDADKREKLKKMLHDKLSNDSTKIYARNTRVTQISNKEASEFCNKYHLQGAASASISIGEYLDKELVAVMTFGTPRFNNNYQWELVRLAYKSGISLVGGAEKMFKYFEQRFTPTSMVSYCDISKFRGNVYIRLGFKTSSKDITSPNYVWVDDNQNVISRYKTQKGKLIENGLGNLGSTEDEIMKNLGYYKVYDCGNLRLTWEKQ